MTDLEEIGLKEEQKVLRVPGKELEYKQNEFGNRFYVNLTIWLISQFKSKDYDTISDLFSKVTDRFVYGIDYDFDEETTSVIESEMPYADRTILAVGESSVTIFYIMFTTACGMNGLINNN